MLLSTLMAGVLLAEAPDSIQAVTIVADRGMVVSRTDTVTITNTITVTDALERLPGLQVTDNGGAGGLKTVSLRGLGAAHTALYIDGVRVGNVQSGQADLCMLDLGCFSSAVIDYAQNSLSFYSAKPTFTNGKASGQVATRYGSFGTIEQRIRMNFRLSDRTTLSATATGGTSEGNYPIDGDTRSNNDSKQFRSMIDLRGESWHAKAYVNGSDRGLPGAVAYPSTDRQRDWNAFLQGAFRKQLSTSYLLLVSAKASYDDLFYKSTWGDSRYAQTEYQINTSHKFRVTQWLDASVTADFHWDGLKSTGYDAKRSKVTSAAAASFHTGTLRANAALEYSGYFEAQNRHAISPSLDIRWKVFKGLDLVGFCRRSFRAPVFNELYYPGFGNPELKPEDATLTDIGAEFSRAISPALTIKAKADVFYNFLKDKIISAPTEADPSIWLPYNIGQASVTGADMEAALSYSGRRLSAAFSARYSYQDAIDRTSGQQIPFIARHTAALEASAAIKGWSAALSWNLREGRFDSAGPIPGYSTLNLTASKEIQLPVGLAIDLKIIARNLADCRYELASGYPMPGRSLLGEIDLKF